MFLQVDSIPEGFENGTVEDWLVLFSGIIQSSSRPVCVAWLDNELSERSSDVKEVPSKLFNPVWVDMHFHVHALVCSRV